MNRIKPLLIKNGRIIDPAQGIDDIRNLLITEGKVAWLGDGTTNLPSSSYEIYDAENLIVCPGFIDLHCHLREPGYEQKETIATGSRAAAKGGFTTICCMPNTKPPLDNAEILGYVKSIAAKDSPVRVLPIGCITLGRKGETATDMVAMAKAGAVAFSDDGDTVTDVTVLARAFENSLIINLPVIEHCENNVMSAGGQINEGEIARRLKLKGIPAEAEASIVKRDVELARTTGGKLHIAHVSTAESVAIIRRAKAEGINVTAEVTPHHLTLTEIMALGYNTNAKVNPPLATKKDSNALMEGLKDGTIDAIATDHAPHSKIDKDCDFTKAAFGISGFETALGSLMNLVHNGQLSLNLVIEKLTTGPVKVLGNTFKNIGSLAVGNPAELTIFNPELSWVVDTDKFVSKGKNTPLAGATLKGRVVLTIYGGDIVYKEVE